MRSMKIFGLLAFLAVAAPVYGDSILSVTLDDQGVQVSGPAGTSPAEVLFTGTVTDLDSANTADCFGGGTCLFVDNITFTFDQDPAVSLLSADSDPFYSLPGVLSADGNANDASEQGALFGIVIDPATPYGTYTGTATIQGSEQGPYVDDLSATVDWTLVVAPEPSAFGLALPALATLWLRRKRVAV